LLLGSIFVTASLGLGLSAAHRIAAVLCLVAAVPAWLGWSGLTRGPWLIPRWQDPIDEVAAYHLASRVPRALVSNQPALAFTIAHMEGDRVAWHDGTHPSADLSSLRWRPLPAGVIAGAIEAYDRAAPQRLKTLDVIVSAHMSTYLAALERELSGRGWSIEDRRSYGEDSLARFRHPKHSVARLELLRFSR
jgi:hypothetical protein